ncbi:MAG: polysaccharide deacetylase family protein [Planctomycetota bacterium]
MRHWRFLVSLFLSAFFAFEFQSNSVGQDSSSAEKRKLAVTIDDGPAVRGNGLKQYSEISRKLKKAFVDAEVPAIMFINEHQIDIEGERSARMSVLEHWLDAGLELGNHTYSHKRLRDTPVDEYFKDILQGEKYTRPLLESKNEKLIWYRYPYLSSERGELATKVEEFLAEHEYRIAPVTVDYHDYSFANNYRRFMQAGEKEQAKQVVAEMHRALEVAFDRAEANEKNLVGRPMHHVLLIHCNEINADTLPVTLKKIQDCGYEFVSIAHAMEDPVYKRTDLLPGTMGGSFFGGLQRLRNQEGTQGNGNGKQ